MSPAYASFTDAQQPVYPVASLIDHHRRAARRSLQTAVAIRWELAQPWVYLRVYHRADIFTALADAANHRQALGCLLAAQRAGWRYVTSPRCRHHRT